MKERKDWVSDIDKSKITLYEICGGIIVLSIIEMIVGLFIVDKIGGFLLGTVIGTVIAILLVQHMYRTIDKALDYSEDDAMKITRNGAILRMIVLFTITVIVVCMHKYVNAYMVFICIMNLKLAAYLQPFTHKIFKKLFAWEDVFPPGIPDEEEEG